MKVKDHIGREFEVYMNNPRLRAEGQTVKFTQHEVKEYLRCMQDPIYFTKNYIKIVNVDEGVIPFKLYPFQEKMIETYAHNRFAVTLCPRQVGKSTTVVAYLLWFILFQDSKNCCILAHKGATAREILSRLRDAYEMLPLWMQKGVKVWNKGSIELENRKKEDATGSKVVAAATSSGSIRGQSFNVILLDEFAFVPNNMADEFFSSVYPTIASGKTTQVIIVSTPNGMNHFYKIWSDANKAVGEKGKNAYVPIRVYWQDVPGRDEKWKEQTIANTSLRQFRQENECAFLGSAGTLIDGVVLERLVFETPIYEKDSLRIYEMPDKDHHYVITVDCGKGMGMDASAFSVFDVTEIPYKQVACYENNTISHLIYPNAIEKVARMYNNAYVLVELNDVGQSVADILYSELEYEELFFVETQQRLGQTLSTGVGGRQVKLGVQQSVSTKNLGCANLKSLIEDNKLIVRDFNTIQELSTFIQKGKSFEAEEGRHDDLVMTLVMFGWLTNQALFKDLTNTNLRSKLYELQAQAIEDDMLPMFVDDGRPSGDEYQLANGDMVRVVNDPNFSR